MDTHLSHLQALDPAPLVVAVLVAAVLALAVVEPITGRRGFARFLLAEAREGEVARLRFYRRWILHGCATAVLTLALVLALPGVGLSDLGLRAPSLGALDGLQGTEGGVDASTLAGLVVGAAVGLLLGGIALGIAMRRRAARTGASAAPPQLAVIQPMLPRSGRGRWGWAGLSLSAGVTEEITYRGLVVLTLALTLPGSTPAPVVVAVAAVIFGAAHWYQGRAGILTTTVVGAGLAALYLSTGSLLLPMVLHTLVDLRTLLLPGGSHPSAPAPDPGSTAGAASGTSVLSTGTGTGERATTTTTPPSGG